MGESTSSMEWVGGHRRPHARLGKTVRPRDRRTERRDIDLAKMQQLIAESGAGLADAVDLRFSTREEVRRVKMDDPEKVYLAHVAVHGKVNKEKVNEVVHTFKHRRISQQTPVRVVHRRADLDREKEIIDAAVESFDDDVLVLRLRTQSGTYVKELVSGDNGRTKPNLAGTRRTLRGYRAGCG